MARLKGSRDSKQRKRRTKSVAEKKKDNDAKVRQKTRDEALQRDRNGVNFRASLFRGSNSKAVAVPPQPEPTVDNDAVELRRIPCWTEQVDPEEITAELDYNLVEEQECNDVDTSDTSDAPEDSVMNSYLRAIQTRLKLEVLEDTKDDEKWLKKMLTENDWWIRHQQAESLCKKLVIIFAEIAYYRDVYVWLPEQRWGQVAWPPCPSCLQQNKIGAHGWQKNHYARRVVTMNSNYFVTSRRYICHSCNRETSKESNNQATTENSQGSTQIQQASFMGYNPTSRSRLPFGLGEYFPAFFTHRAAVDMSVIDMMQALFDKGVRPESYAETMLELHSKKHTDDYLRREFAIEQRRGGNLPSSRDAVLELRSRRCSPRLQTRRAMVVLCQPENTCLRFTSSSMRQSGPISRKKSRSSHRNDFISMLRTRKQNTLHSIMEIPCSSRS